MKTHEANLQRTQNSPLFITIASAVALAMIFLLAGCSESPSEGYNGGNGNGSQNGNGGGGIGFSPTFSDVGQVFAANCADCHIGMQESGVRLNSYANVMESVGDQYGTLVVLPGDADNSPLVEKIESSNPTHGVRMPEGGPFLSAERIEQIKDWIDAGAENN